MQFLLCCLDEVRHFLSKSFLSRFLFFYFFLLSVHPSLPIGISGLLIDFSSKNKQKASHSLLSCPLRSDAPDQSAAFFPFFRVISCLFCMWCPRVLPVLNKRNRENCITPSCLEPKIHYIYFIFFFKFSFLSANMDSTFWIRPVVFTCLALVQKKMFFLSLCKWVSWFSWDLLFKKNHH